MILGAAKIITVNPSFLTYAFGTLCPILVALLTKINAPSAVKAVLNALLACLAALLALAIKQQGHIDLYGWGVAFAQAFIAATASYAGLWRHIVAPQVANATANFGIGPAVDQPYDKAA